MNPVYSEIEGSNILIQVNSPEYIDPLEVFKAMGISDGKHFTFAMEAVAMTTQFLQSAFPHIAQYSAPRKSFIQKTVGMLSRPNKNSSLKWILKHAIEFNAGVDQSGTEFVIAINYGAIVRAASLCCEIAAIEKDGLFPSGRPTILESWLGGALFSVVPDSLGGRERYMQLLKTVILYLFSHEFAHVAGGHCGYFNQNSDMSDSYRKAVEADADYVGGGAAGASIAHHMEVAKQLGWSSCETPEDNSMHLLKTCVLGSLILAILFSELTDSKSKRYLRPALRFRVFIVGLQFYFANVERMPNQADINVHSQFQSPDATRDAQMYGVSLLKRSSVGGAVSEMDLQESDMNEITSIYDLRDSLKKEFNKHLPFGMKEYLEQAKVSISRPT